MILINLTVFKNGFIAIAVKVGEDISISLNFKNITDITLRNNSIRISQSTSDESWFLFEFDEKDNVMHDDLISLMVAFAEYGGEK